MRILCFRREDLDDVARLELRRERHKPAVHLRSGATVSDICVDPVCEIDRSRACRQHLHVPCRSESEHLVLIEIQFQCFEELLGIISVLLHVSDVFNHQKVGLFGPVVLIAPMSGDPCFGTIVHLLRANLNLERFAVRTNHRCVQRLVEVELRHRDVVLEATLNRRPHRVHETESAITITEFIDDHPNADEIVDVFERQTRRDHLAVDGVEVFRPPGDLGTDAVD